MKQNTRLITIGLFIWFCLALAIGVTGWFQDASALLVAATVWILTGMTLLTCWKVPAVRSSVISVDLRLHIAVHLTRFVGIYFLILSGRGALPIGFAWPAGVGDTAIAAGALLILLIPQLLAARKILAMWNALGLLDIVLVVFAALRFGLQDSRSMAPLRQLPLSLLPTYIVPLIITSHVVIFARLKVDAASRRLAK